MVTVSAKKYFYIFLLIMAMDPITSHGQATNTRSNSSQRANRESYTIYFTGINCLGGRCADLNQKVVLFNDRILWSYDENPRGIVFTNNRTIDLFNDPDNDRTTPSAPQFIVRQTATAFGKADGNGVYLLIHREGIDRRGMVVTNYNQEIKIDFISENECAVTSWRQFGNAYSRTIESRFTQNSCRLRRGVVDLPH